MSKQLLGIIIAVISVAAIGGTVYVNQPESLTPAQQATMGSSAVQPETYHTYTPAEVAGHNNEDDCWTIIEGEIYNITEYIPRHPGGSEILRACGADGSGLFNSRKTADGEEIGSGTPHSSNARAILQRFRVGSLAR